MPLSKINLALVLFWVATSAAAQSKLSLELTKLDSWLPSRAEWERVQEKAENSVVFDVENDSLLLKRDDGFYTSGSHFSLLQKLMQDDAVVTYSWHIGQDLYTASDIKLKPSQLSPLDHPYAGWLYLGAFREVQNNDGRALRLGLDFGCLGPCAGGEWTQTNLHRLLNQALPQAWSTQLRREWGIVAHLEAAPARWNLQSDMDLANRVKLRVGNIFTDLQSELVWRYGNLNQQTQNKSSFIFTRANLSIVAYNATLQGGLFSQNESAIHPRPLVAEVEAGYQFQGSKWGLYASVLRRGSEIKELSHAKAAQNFAKIQVYYKLGTH
ncbi:lipid A deacylase LpxR family protein [Undibacterium fentianense]|uniref:Lipid A deacylase LpxR family protein n=1 Tax=Undibacterium fentianense TaxID=2828728 RepID=A0A941E157_9BURK|nr:lipid A deacylase LpxR family protein [Undibacterium fentianense]MBR7799046.1 lipid A deacylase LpxR family protein [Undibacterium fentianense]